MKSTVLSSRIVVFAVFATSFFALSALLPAAAQSRMFGVQNKPQPRVEEELDERPFMARNGYLSLLLHGGLNTLNFKLSLGERKIMPGFGFSVDYNYFFGERIGVTFGGGFNYMLSKVAIDATEVVQRELKGAYDAPVYNSEYRVNYTGWEEKQVTMAVDVPLGLIYRRPLNDNYTLVIDGGGKLVLPVVATYQVTAGRRVMTGRVDDLDLNLGLDVNGNPIDDLRDYGYYPDDGHPSGDNKLKFGVGAFLNVNMTQKLGDLDFFYGVYGSMGFTPMQDGNGGSITDINTGEYRGILQSDVADAASFFAVGVRAGIKLVFPRPRKFKPVAATGGPGSGAVVGKPGIKISSLEREPDEDGDGVPDSKDKCPDTPVEARGKVDANGCPLDSDGDGIPDYKDKCPNTRGDADNDGCPPISDEARLVLQNAEDGLKFDMGKTTMKNSSRPLLDEVAKMLNDNPDFKLHIKAYADRFSKGVKPADNEKLSTGRAKAIKDYLQSKGIKAARLRPEGMGNTEPPTLEDADGGAPKKVKAEFEIEF